MSRVTRSDRLRLDDISTLTFYQNDKTRHRRKPPIQQLTCQGNPCQRYQPDVVQCTNVGGSPPDWACQAELPANVRLGRVEVSCEGWTDHDDGYILKGSCGLDYRLVPMDSYPAHTKSASWTSNPVALAAIALTIYLLWRAWRTGSSGAAPYGPPGNGNDGPPFPPWSPFNRPGDDPPPYDGKTAQRGAQQQRQGGGYWTGLATGALGGIAAQRLFGGQTQPRQRTRLEDRWQERRAGPSNDNAGQMRTSTGYGGTVTR